MRQRLASLLVFGCLGIPRLYAADVAGEIGIGAIYTDNIRLVATDTQTDTIGVLSTDFLVHEQTRHLDAEVAANLQYLTYAHNIYTNELLGDLAGYGRFALLPGRLDWVVQENFGQQQLSPGTPITPLNLENINYLSTGPDVSVPLGSQLHAQMSVRYSKVSYQLHNNFLQLNDLNNNRGDASLALVHPLSATSNASLNASAERVSFDDSIDNPDYTTRLGYLHYDAQGARSKLTLDVGYDDALVEGARSHGALVRADATRALSGASTLELSVGQDISDTGNLLRQMQTSNNVTLATGALQRSEDPFTNRYARANWRFDRHRTGFGLALTQFRETHTIESNLNRTRTELDANARRNLSEALVLSAAAGYAHDSYFSSTTPSDTYRWGTADVAWRFGRRVQLRVQYSHIDQRSAAVSNTYTENRFMLTVGLATEKSAGIPLGNPIR
jgi:hypothetical protein